MDFVKCEINFHPFIHNSNLYSMQHETLGRMIIISGPVRFLLYIFTTFFLFSIWITKLKTKWKINNDLHEIFVLFKDIYTLFPNVTLFTTNNNMFPFFFRPKSGSMLLYSRKKVRYRRDGYCWKKRKDGKTTREDHMKLKVQGTEVSFNL